MFAHLHISEVPALLEQAAEALPVPASVSTWAPSDSAPWGLCGLLISVGPYTADTRPSADGWKHEIRAFRQFGELADAIGWRDSLDALISAHAQVVATCSRYTVHMGPTKPCACHRAHREHCSACNGSGRITYAARWPDAERVAMLARERAGEE